MLNKVEKKAKGEDVKNDRGDANKTEQTKTETKPEGESGATEKK